MGRLRPASYPIFGLAIAALMVGCANTRAGDAADADAPQTPDTTVTDAADGASQEPDAEMASATKLDLDTLRADTPEGTLRAERADNSYVGSIGDGRAIGVAFLDDVTAGEEQSHQHQIVVYLYDREDLAVMTGELDTDGTATLESGDLSDFDAAVEVMMDGDAVSGTATFPGERPTPFTADAATGIAGVYWAHETGEEPEVRGDWVVLSDGRQWGCVCAPPFVSPCCHLGL